MLQLKNKVITIDCDEVLCDTVGYVLKYTDFFSSHFGIEQYADVDLEKLSQMYYSIHDNFDEMILSNTEVYQHMQPILGAVEVVKKLHTEGYELYVITGRTENMREFTKKWLDIHFPGMISDVFFCNNYKAKAIAKVDFCRQVGSALMIDDDPRFIDDISHIPVLLFDRPWNQDYTGNHAQRVKTWEEILVQIFDE